MWLLKKFWHADIVYKIYILIILFVVVVATITVVTRYKNAYELEKVNSEQNIVTQNEVNNISEEGNIEIEKETIASVEKTKEKTEESKKTPDIISNTNENSVTTPSKEIAKQEAVKDEKATPKPTPKVEEVKKEETKEVQTQSSLKTEEPLKEKVTEEKKTENTNENKQEKVEETKPTEEYKINTEMINTMKSVINNNPSETMKTYGYEVAVDSSILELTDQFTYTEQRLRDKITYKFGTIRIYAQDYYYNGRFVSTQCFII